MSPRDADRFWAKVNVRGAEECWTWTAATGPDGRGRFSVGGRAGGMQSAHRVAFELTYGPLGERHVLHSCDNPACVNPNHLRAGTHAENMRDMAERERSRTTKITAHDVIDIRRRAAAGESYRSIATELGIARSNVGMIARRVTWRHVQDPVDGLITLLSGGVQ